MHYHRPGPACPDAPRGLHTADLRHLHIHEHEIEALLGQDFQGLPAVLHGLVYPADHSFWSTFYPPNGFRCRCTVQTLSKRQVQAPGYEVQKDRPGLIEPVDPATGERLPPVRPFPDKGFVGNAAEEWLAGSLR